MREGRGEGEGRSEGRNRGGGGGGGADERSSQEVERGEEKDREMWEGLVKKVDRYICMLW